MSSIFEIIGLLEEAINRSPKPRVGGANKRIIDYDQILDFLGDLKVSIPDEIRQAQAVLSEKTNLLKDAENQAYRMLSDARIESERMISESGVIEETQKRGNEIVAHAEEKANIIVQGARVYTDQILVDVQKYLQQHMKTIEENRNELKQTHTEEEEFRVRSAAEDAIIRRAAQERVSEMKTDSMRADKEEVVEAEPTDEMTDSEDMFSEKEESNFDYINDDLFHSDDGELRQGVEIEVGRSSFFLQDDGLDLNLYASQQEKKENSDEKSTPKQGGDDDKKRKKPNRDSFPWSE